MCELPHMRFAFARGKLASWSGRTEERADQAVPGLRTEIALASRRPIAAWLVLIALLGSAARATAGAAALRSGDCCHEKNTAPCPGCDPDGANNGNAAACCITAPDLAQAESLAARRQLAANAGLLSDPNCAPPGRCFRRRRDLADVRRRRDRGCSSACGAAPRPASSGM